MDLISQVHMKNNHTARLTLAGHGGGDVLHAVHTKKQRNRDSNVRRKQSRQRTVKTTNKHGKRKPAHLVLHYDEEGQRESGGADAQGDSRQSTAARNARPGQLVEAPPNVRLAWRRTEVAHHVRHG